jgi:type I restriction enzyme, S subunit
MHNESATILKNKVKILSGYPFASQFFSNDYGIPLIRIRDLLVQKTETYFSKPYPDLYTVRNGDILVGMDGDFNIVHWQGGNALLNQRVCKVTSISANLDEMFLFYWLQPNLQDIEQRTSKTTVRHLSTYDILQISMPPFSLFEQQHIAHILDTLDTQIQQTETLIAKLKYIKLGLLHDLLTRGINENGDVRDPVAHPEEFKKTVLGKVPQKWKVSTLGDVVHSNGGLIQTGPFGSQLHAHEYVHEGVPVIMPQDIENERINIFQMARITPTKASKLSRHSVEFNDVIFGRRGDLDRCTFIDLSEVDFICGTDCLLVRPPKKLIDGRWLAAIYRHHHSQEQIRAKAVGSIMLGLNSTLLAKLVIAVPPLIEQKAIMDKIATFTDNISIEESDLAKLKQIKKGLMHDLLTGHVCVTQLIAEREQLSI